jgi:hyperosmotically inducible periplasmic protein
MKTFIRIACYLSALLPTVLLASSADSQIEEAANNSYNYKAVLNGHVKVKSEDGVVTLTGTVPDKADRTLAQDTVENLPGVVRVDNEITVDSSYPEYSDTLIALKIHGMLLVRANVSEANTKVAVRDGVVTLTGTAESDAQKALTEAYVTSVDHVKSVNNQLVVVSAPPSNDSAVDDASITGQVKYELFTDRNTSAMRTKVKTEHGVVIITGEADSSAEKDLVTRMAETIRGVRSVDNLMTVRS